MSNLSERLEGHIQNIREDSDFKNLIDSFCRALGFTKLNKVFKGAQEYIKINSNFNLSIFFDSDRLHITFKVQTKEKGRINNAHVEGEWDISNKNKDHVLKDIQSSVEDYL